MEKLDSVMVRMAVDDFEAFRIADVMQSFQHVEVVSIVFERLGIWHVFAKFASDKVHPDQIDDKIDQVVFPPVSPEKS